MLIVVQHGFVEPLPQLGLDRKTFRRREVLELDRAERHLDGGDGFHDALDLCLAQQNRHAVDPDQIRKQRRLAFHHRQSGECSDISQAEHRGAVGHDRDGIVDAGEITNRSRIVLDREADSRHTGCVDVPQHLLSVDRDTRDCTDLAAAMTIENAIRLAEKAGRGQLANAVIQAAIRFLVHLQRQLPHCPPLVAAQRGQMLDRQAGIGDDLQHLRQAPGLVDGLDDQNFRNLHTAAVLDCPQSRGGAWRSA